MKFFVSRFVFAEDDLSQNGFDRAAVGLEQAEMVGAEVPALIVGVAGHHAV